MTGEHFICYSTIDAQDFALKLSDGLETGIPQLRTWLDKNKLQLTQKWDVEIEKAIPDSASLLYVITQDSVKFESECRDEMNWAMACKRPIIPLIVHSDAQVPYRCYNRQRVYFTRDFDSALLELREKLLVLNSPAGILRTLEDRLEDLKHDLRHCREDSLRARLENEILDLERQITNQQKVVEDPNGARERVNENIKRGLERERVPETPAAREASGKFINPPPTRAPSHFQDRDQETKLILDFLKDESRRVITVVGRGGVGKTAMVCRLLNALESGRSPDGKEQIQADGIVYLSAVGLHRITMANLFSDLCKLVSPDAAEKLDAVFKDALSTPEAKMELLLDSFRTGLFVVLLDNFEDLIDPETHDISDRELSESLKAILTLPHHAVKVIITTRIAPRSLTLVQPARQIRLNLDEGLPSPHAENLLREMDVDGTIGLKTASDELLNKARERTRGYPRALEALFAILSEDRTSLEELIKDTGKELPANVVEELVGQAFNRLDNNARQVMQALAIYGRPIPPVAVDFLLQPFLPGVDSAPVLNRLVKMHYVRKDGARYLLHPIDREYALSRVPSATDPNHRNSGPDYSQKSLYLRAADYFREISKDQAAWKSIADVEPQLNEFEMRCAGDDYETAAMVLMGSALLDYRYLYPWGHYQLLIDLHEKVRGRIQDRYLIQRGLTHLGIAYAELGRIAHAITATEESLIIARELGNVSQEGILLGNLGTFESDLGNTANAVKRHEQALELGGSSSYWEKAVALNNLGTCFGDLGQFVRAGEVLSEAVPLAHLSGDGAREAVIIANLAESYVDVKNYREAIEIANRAIEVGTPIDTRKALVLGHRNRALAHLFARDLEAARSDADKAVQFDLPQFKHSCLVLLGLVALLQNDNSAAETTCAEAAAEAEKVIKNNPRQFRAWDTKGLALAVLELNKNGTDFTAAAAAHRRAREIATDAGAVSRILRLYQQLAKCDPDDHLKQVRQAAEGIF